MTSTNTDAVDDMALQTPSGGSSRRGDASLALLFEERCDEVVDLLSRRWWSWRRPWNAERRSNLAYILAELGEARRLEAALRLPEGTRMHLRTLLRHRIGTLTFDGTLEVRDELRKALIPIGDDRYLGALLEAERARQAVYDATGRSSALLWSELHGMDAGLDEDPAARLLAFSEARREQYRADRQGVQVRQHVLLSLTPVLALLAGGLAIASGLLIDRAEAGRIVLLVVCAGGLGALLGSVRPLREELAAGADLRAYLPAMLAEPLLGAVAGLLMLLVGETGVLGPRIADGDVWARAGLLAFAAGFAEPFLLRAVGRIAGFPVDDLGPRRTGADRGLRDDHEPLQGPVTGRRSGARFSRGGTVARHAGVSPTHYRDERPPAIRNEEPPGGRENPPASRP